MWFSGGYYEYVPVDRCVGSGRVSTRVSVRLDRGRGWGCLYSGGNGHTSVGTSDYWCGGGPGTGVTVVVMVTLVCVLTTSR